MPKTASMDLLIQNPPTPAQLILLLHGEGGKPQDMAPLGRALSAAFPQALIVAMQAPLARSDPHTGHTWFHSKVELGRSNPADLQPALNQLAQRIHAHQANSGVSTQATALIGFGQGATLALHSTLLNAPWADRVVALAGAFAQRPEAVRYLGSIHFLHGKEDAITHWKTVMQDAYCLRDHGVDMTAEIVPLVGHELHTRFIDKTLERLSTHVSKHLFEAAVASAPGAENTHIQ